MEDGKCVLDVRCWKEWNVGIIKKGMMNFEL